jgi:hypothetical protein
VIGSTFVARRAGIKQAASATAISIIVVNPNVSGSVALTPNNRVFIIRITANDAINPIPTPVLHLSHL